MRAVRKRILTINPNSSVSVTAAIDEALKPLRIAGGPDLAVDTLKEGPPSISSQRDSDSVIIPLANWIARDDADAFVIACFSDPGLHSAREAAVGRPVMGIAECGVLRALTLGERFGVIALSASSVRRQQRMMRQIGVDSRYAGSWPVHASAAETAGAGIRDRLIQAGQALVKERAVDVVVMGCAGMASHRLAIEQAIGVPVVEPVQQAVAMAIGAVLLKSSPTTTSA